MKNINFILVCLLPHIFLSSEVSAAKVEVHWLSPDKYHDIKPGDNNRKTFEANVFRNFENHFTKLANQLPADQTLKIDVTDVDLAGDVNYGGIHRIRIVEELFFPRIKFSYKLENADKSLADSGDINLKDMNFMTSSNLRYRNDAFGYDKRMIDNWFKKTFKVQLLKK